MDVWINGIDMGFQENEEEQEDIDARTEGLAQLMEDSQAEATTKYEARVEAMRHMVKEAERKAEAEEMKRKAEAAEREAEAARLQADVIVALTRTNGWTGSDFKFVTDSENGHSKKKKATWS